MKFKKILVTGGAGFVGLHMVDALLARGVNVRVLDNFMCSRRETLAPYLKRIELIEGDIRNPKDVQKAVHGADAVFHLAAIRSVVKTVEDPIVAHEVNATGTLLLLHAAKQAGVQHFIFTSTSSVYGEAIGRRQREESFLKPISPYGIAKLAAEGYARYFFREKKFPTTSVRIFNVYGPRQNPESKYSLLVPGVLSKISKGERPLIDGTGEQSRDFIYIEDVLDALFRILGNPKSYGQVYNLGSGQSTPVKRIVQTLLRLTGSKLKPIHGLRRPSDPERTCADISKVNKELGWKPRVSLEAGLKKTVERVTS